MPALSSLSMPASYSQPMLPSTARLSQSALRQSHQAAAQVQESIRVKPLCTSTQPCQVNLCQKVGCLVEESPKMHMLHKVSDLKLNVQFLLPWHRQIPDVCRQSHSFMQCLPK